MRLIIFLISAFILNKSFARNQPDSLPGKYVVVIHGGAGTLSRSQMSPEKEAAYRAGIDKALLAGNEILRRGGNAIDAVEACVTILEDNPLFNAGKGAVFTNEGKNELDAAIMDGSTLKAGAVAGVTTIRNPVKAARAVMEKSEHVMMIGRGAEQFAKVQGLELVDPSYFFTEERWKSLQKAKVIDSTSALKKNKAALLKWKVDSIRSIPGRSFEANMLMASLDSFALTMNDDDVRAFKRGTVGAVALDLHGNLAAATSTGGMTNKKYGRVGDAPVIGAGTYANNKTAAISGTGWGEYYIRLVLAKTISDMMLYGKKSLREAADEMVMKELPALGGDGGLIAVDKDGNIAMPFCTEGMYRGYINSKGEKSIMIFREN